MAWKLVEDSAAPAQTVPKGWRLVDESGPAKEVAFSRGLRDGLSFGWGDELAGLGAGSLAALQGGDYNKAYRRQADASRAALKEASDTRPLSTGAGQIGGALATSIIPGGAVARGVGVAGRLGIAAGAGVGVGALQGAGEGITPEERLRGGAIGGALGGVVGLGGGALAEAAPAAWRAGRRAIGLPERSPRGMTEVEQTLDDLTRTAKAAGFNTPDELQAAMTTAAGRDPSLTVAEIMGQPGQARLAYLARARGETGQKVEDYFTGRAGNQAGELENAVLGRAPASGDALEQDLARQWETRGRELYEPVLSAPMSPEATALFQSKIAPRLRRGSQQHSPALEEAWNRAGRLIQEEVSLGRLPADAAAALPRRLHFTKIALDDMVRDPLSVPSGLRHVSNAQMAQIARHFADTLEPASGRAILPGYRQARGELADIATARDAVKAGREAFTRQRFPSDEALARHMAALTPGERPHFLAGVEDALSNMITSAGRDGRRNVANSLLNDRTQARLRAIFGREEADAMIASVRSVGAKFEFGQRVRPTQGSITSNIMMQLAPGGILGAGIGGANAEGDPVSGAAMGALMGAGGGYLARRAAASVWANTLEKAIERQNNMLGRVYLSPVADFTAQKGGLLSRAAQEARRREERLRLVKTREALAAGLGATGLYSPNDQ